MMIVDQDDNDTNDDDADDDWPVWFNQYTVLSTCFLMIMMLNT